MALESASWDFCRQTRCEMELAALAPRCLRPGKEAQRRRLLEVLVELATAGHLQIALSRAAELLADNKTLWKSKEHGQALVLAACRQRRFAALRWLVAGSPPLMHRTLEELEEALKPRVPVMHYALGCALLTWARELFSSADTVGVERALATLGLLDPPRYFAEDIHRFKRETQLSDDARHLADHIHRMAKSNGGADACVYALSQCIDELQQQLGTPPEQHAEGAVAFSA